MQKKPRIVFGYKNAPTQTYLDITGQEKYYGTLELGEKIPGSRGMGGSARTGDARSETERTRAEGERSEGERNAGRGKGENDVSDLLSGFDWYNNNVQYGEEAIIVQANRNAEIHAIFILLPVPSVVASCYILRNLQCNIVHISAHRRLLCTVVHAYSGINLQLKL